MFSEYLMLLIIAHLIGDFYLQSKKLSKAKEESVSRVFLHSLLYSFPYIIVFLFSFNFSSFITYIFVMVVISHSIIDLIKYSYHKNCRNKGLLSCQKERFFFFFDQILHLIILVLAAYLLNRDITVDNNTVFQKLYILLNIKSTDWINWVLALLLIGKPSNILIGKLLMVYKVCQSDEDTIKKEIEPNPGELIGILERIMILLLISLNQYSAIALVLAAKSIARYDKISKDKNFAEYYLLGTLLSICIVIIIALVLLKSIKKI